MLKSTSSELNLTNLNHQIWEEEILDFFPQKIFDVHTNIYRWKFNLDINKKSNPYSYQGRYFMK